MSVFKKFAESIVKRGKVTAEDVTLTKAMFDELTSEEQETEQPALESVEAEAAKTVEAEAAAKAEAEKVEADKVAADEAAKVAAEAAAKAAEGKEPGEVAAAELSEAKSKLTEANAKLAELTEKESARTLAEQVSKLTLSETNSRGFSKAHNPALKDFMASLSEDQRVTFSELVSKYVTVNTKEVGSGIDGATLDDAKITHNSTEFAVTGAEVDMAIKALAETKKISYFEAAKQYAETHKS